MSAFGFLNLRGGRGKPASSSQPAGDPVNLVGTEALVARTQALRNKIHAHLHASSRDYAVLTSLRTSKVEYCGNIARDVTRRLASNPFFEVLQHLDEAQAEIRRPADGK